jgi:hypothetical protein
MDSRVHIIIAVIAAFAGGEVTGMALTLVLRSRIRYPWPPPGGRQRGDVQGRVIPISRYRPEGSQGRQGDCSRAAGR